MNPSLRIIQDIARGPAFNMAADLFLLESCVKEHAVVVRMYEWVPASITVGYMQKVSEALDFTAMEKDMVAWVRRPTGGRAVLHEHDLTYSCIFPTAVTAMGINVMETYAIISKCLMAGLTHAGIACTVMDSFDRMRETKREIKLPCFLAPNREEIMVQGRKLVGSAQKRTAAAVLQHGSIPVDDAYRKLPDYVRLSEIQRAMQKQLLASKSICLKEIDPQLTSTDLRKALMTGFTAVLPFEAERRSWSAEDLETIEALTKNKEFRDTWMTA